MFLRKKIFAVLALSLVLVCSAQAKKLSLLAISKGEAPDDNKRCEVSLSEDNGDKHGDFTLLLKFEQKGWAAVDKPKKGGWSSYKTVHLNIFNPSDKALDSVAFMVKGAKMTETPDNRKDWPLALKPGKNEVVLELKGQICADGKSVLDVSHVLRWAFYNLTDTDGIVIYIQRIWLEE